MTPAKAAFTGRIGLKWQDDGEAVKTGMGAAEMVWTRGKSQKPKGLAERVGFIFPLFGMFMTRKTLACLTPHLEGLRGCCRNFKHFKCFNRSSEISFSENTCEYTGRSVREWLRETLSLIRRTAFSAPA